MVRIVVNDANILIDIVELELLPHFFGLEFEYQTTDLVLDELFDDQLIALRPYIDKGVMSVVAMTVEDIIEIQRIEASKSSLSLQDCSAYYLAKKLNATLLTSDNSLRKFARENHLNIHGHLWIFDQMIETQTLTGPQAIEKLSELCDTINPRLGLPKRECDRRIKIWMSK